MAEINFDDILRQYRKLNIPLAQRNQRLLHEIIFAKECATEIKEKFRNAFGGCGDVTFNCNLQNMSSDIYRHTFSNLNRIVPEVNVIITYNYKGYLTPEKKKDFKRMCDLYGVKCRFHQKIVPTLFWSVDMWNFKISSFGMKQENDIFTYDVKLIPQTETLGFFDVVKSETIITNPHSIMRIKSNNEEN